MIYQEKIEKKGQKLRINVVDKGKKDRVRLYPHMQLISHDGKKKNVW